jgi:hypothetical protein
VIAKSRRSTIRNPTSRIDRQIMAAICAKATHAISAAERPESDSGLRNGVQIFAHPAVRPAFSPSSLGRGDRAGCIESDGSLTIFVRLPDGSETTGPCRSHLWRLRQLICRFRCAPIRGSRPLLSEPGEARQQWENTPGLEPGSTALVLRFLRCACVSSDGHSSAREICGCADFPRFCHPDCHPTTRRRLSAPHKGLR